MVLGAAAQTDWVEIPLGFDEIPTGRDSFIAYQKTTRPRITLALSGGGARGLAQIGVLKSFERHGIPIDGIAGTSIGAIVGGLACLGYSAAEIESLAYQIRWEQIIRDTPPRKQLFLGQKEERAQYLLQLRLKGLSFDIPSAYTAGQQLNNLITDLVLNAPLPSSAEFDNLHIPLRVITTDLLTGEKVVLSKGSLIQALRASMTIPLLFNPVKIGDALLVDGGLLQNLPVAEARAMGHDLVIAVDTSSKLRDSKLLRAPWEIADQVTTIMQQDRVRSQLDSADVPIQPDIEGISNTEFDKIDILIRAGEEATENMIPLIEKSFTRSADASSDTTYDIKRVSIIGCRRIDPYTLLSNTTIDTSSPVSVSQIVWSGQTLLQTGHFRKVSAMLDTATKHLQLIVEENPFINDIQILGNHAFSDSTLFACMDSKPGEILNTQKGRRDRRRLISMYHKAGYALARIDTIRIDGGILTIHINEGVVDEIRLSGNYRTRPFVILRELPLKPGDLFNVASIKQGIENIYSTEYFEGVSFDIQKKGHRNVVELQLTEQGYTLVRLGIRYDLERKTKGFLRIVETNLIGAGIKGSIMGLMGNRDGVLQARLWTDRLFKTLLTCRLDLSAEKRDFYYYQNHRRIGEYTQTHRWGSFSLGQQMRRLGTLSLMLKTEGYNLKPFAGDTGPREKYNLVNISIRSVVDTRDRLPFPRAGKYHILEYETAGRFLGSEVSYSKLFSSFEAYFPLYRSLIFHPRISWGTADLTVPFVKQFRMGGLDSFLGLPEEGRVGKRYLIFNGEFRQRIPWLGWLESYISLRYDFGGIWGKYSKITTSDLKHGIGAILSINTPAGPIQIGYGHMSDGANQAYLSMGYKF